MSTTLNLSTQDLHSVNFINQSLHNNKAFLYSNGSKPHWLYTSIEQTTLVKAANKSTTNEKIVLVGQAINLSSIEKIITEMFSQVDSAVVTRHHLHNLFSQQAVILHLVHQNDQKLVNKASLLSLSENYYFDCFEVSNVELSKPGILVMDMDSTIIDMECIDEIASIVGVGKKVAALTERAMLGELDFNQSLLARVSCLAGIDVAELDKLKSRLPINPGFAATIDYLHQRGWITCIASGGFTYFANYLKDTFELSAATSNTLGIDGDKLNGTVLGDIVNGEMKKQVLLAACKQHNIDISQTIAIGDGANDLPMMETAALGVAYKAKPKVKMAASANIQYCGFEGLLYCLQR